MPGVHIKRNDNVRVMAGKDRGKEGRVVRVLPEERRVMVDRMREHLAAGRDVFAYFKHEETPEGALYAVEILKENH